MVTQKTQKQTDKAQFLSKSRKYTSHIVARRVISGARIEPNLWLLAQYNQEGKFEELCPKVGPYWKNMPHFMNIGKLWFSANFGH